MIYSSKSTKPLSQAMIEDILDDARTRNEKHGVTGILLYVDDVFLQVVEGNNDVVQQTMERIKSDKRHDSIKVIYESDTEGPLFCNWSMAYIDATPEQLSHWLELEGTSTLQAVINELEQSPERVPGLLLRILKTLA